MTSILRHWEWQLRRAPIDRKGRLNQASSFPLRVVKAVREPQDLHLRVGGPVSRSRALLLPQVDPFFWTVSF